MPVKAVEGLGRVPDPQQSVNEDPAPRDAAPKLRELIYRAACTLYFLTRPSDDIPRICHAASLLARAHAPCTPLRAAHRLLGHRLFLPISLTVGHALDVHSSQSSAQNKNYDAVPTGPRAQGIPFPFTPSGKTHVQHIKYSSSNPMRLARATAGLPSTARAGSPACATAWALCCLADRGSSSGGGQLRCWPLSSIRTR